MLNKLIATGFIMKELRDENKKERHESASSKFEKILNARQVLEQLQLIEFDDFIDEEDFLNNPSDYVDEEPIIEGICKYLCIKEQDVEFKFEYSSDT